MIFDFNAPERKKWSNLPAGIVSRAGVNVGSMSEQQRKLLFEFLSLSLSEEGYNQIAQTMAAESILSKDVKAEHYQWAPENYWLSVYGNPKNDDVWGWRFGGHHLAINMSVGKNSIVSISPTFLGTEPAIFSHNGTEYSVFLKIHKAGWDIYDALSEEEKKLALLAGFPSDVSVGPGRDRFVPAKTGVNIGSLNDKKKKLVLE